jgi:hypothetical protein
VNFKHELSIGGNLCLYGGKQGITIRERGCGLRPAFSTDYGVFSEPSGKTGGKLQVIKPVFGNSLSDRFIHPDKGE